MDKLQLMQAKILVLLVQNLQVQQMQVMLMASEIFITRRRLDFLQFALLTYQLHQV